MQDVELKRSNPTDATGAKAGALAESVPLNGNGTPADGSGDSSHYEENAGLTGGQGAEFQPLQAIVSLGAIQVFAMLAGMARIKVLAILLGPAGVGVAGVVDQVVSFVVQLGSLAIPFAALKFISRAHSVDAGQVQRLYAALAKVLLITSCVATLVAIVAASTRPDILGRGLANYRGTVVVALLGVPAIALGTMLKNVLAAHGAHRESAYVGLAAAIALTGASALGVWWDGVTGLFVANLVVAVFTVVITRAYLSRRSTLSLAGLGAPALPVLRAEPGFVRFTGSLYWLALTSPLTYLVSRSLVLDRFGEDAAGYLTAGYGVGLAIRLVLNQANGLYLTPLVNRNISLAHRADASAEYLRILLVLFALGAGLVALFPRLVISILYAARFQPAVALVAAFVIAEGMLLLAGVYQTLLVAVDDTLGFLGCTVVGHLSTLAFTLPLANRLGPLGVAFAFTAGNGAILLFSAIRLVSRYHFWQIVRPLPLVGAGVAVVAIAGWSALHFSHLGVIPRLAAYTITSFGLVRTLSSRERSWLLSPIGQLYRRLRWHWSAR